MVRLDDVYVLSLVQLLRALTVGLRGPTGPDRDAREDFARRCSAHAEFLDDRFSRAAGAEMDTRLSGPFDQDKGDEGPWA